MTPKRLASRSIVILLIAIAPVALADDFDLSWNTIDGGGGYSFGGDFELEGTIGQCDAGRSAESITVPPLSGPPSTVCSKLERAPPRSTSTPWSTDCSAMEPGPPSDFLSPEHSSSRSSGPLQSRWVT